MLEQFQFESQAPIESPDVLFQVNDRCCAYMTGNALASSFYFSAHSISPRFIQMFCYAILFLEQKVICQAARGNYISPYITFPPTMVAWTPFSRRWTESIASRSSRRMTASPSLPGVSEPL